MHNGSQEASTSSQSKPWSSGRVLTEEQRRRKREANRISQKRRKDQLAQRVESLEASFLNLMGTIPLPHSQDSQPHDTASCEQDGEVEIQHAFKPTDTISSELPSIAPLQPSFPPVYGSSVRSQHSDLQYYQEFLASGSYVVPPAVLPVATTLSRTSNSSSAVSDFCYNLNIALFSMPTRIICTDDVENQNMLIHAVLEGWQIIGESGKHCPLWTILQCVDLSISGAAERIERLVLLRTVHIMLLFQVGKLSRESLPTWFRPRPAQLKYKHHTVIDYLVWPGLRERLILDDNLKTTDKFWTLYAKCIRFNWPYNITACYKADPTTGMLSFTELFKSQTNDVNNIQMTSEFFETFPEMADDIPLAQENLGQVFDIDQDLLENWDPYSVSGHNVPLGEGDTFDQTNSVSGIFGGAEPVGLVDFQNLENNRFLGRKT